MLNKLAKAVQARRNPAVAKDLRIAKNMARFLAGHSGVVPPREVALRPEVLIPVYNQGEYVGAGLESLRGAGVPVTVIDDASTDATPEHLAALGRRYEFKLLRNETNLRQSGSLNRAVAESANNLFVVLNADDVLLRYAIRTVLGVFEREPEVRMVGGGSIWFSHDDALRWNDSLPEVLPYAPTLRRYGPADARRFRDVNDINMTMSSCTFTRSAWEAAGGFRAFADRVCSWDDRDFQMRVAALAPVAVLEEPLAFYRISSSTGMGQR